MDQSTETAKLIRAKLEDAGLTQAGLARDLNVTDAHVHQVIEGRSTSHRVRAHISNAIGVDISELWPGALVNGKPRRPGRPKTNGFYDNQAA
jgi:hypothetical protein